MPRHQSGLPAVWEDCSVIPPTAINPTGPDGSMTVITDAAGYLGCLLADANGETCLVPSQVSHGWKKGTDLEPHIHIVRDDPSNNTGPCNFTARWRHFPLQGTVSAWSAWEPCDTTNQPAAGRNETGLVGIVIPGTTPGLGVSSQFQVQFRRGSPGGGNTGDIVVTSGDLHVKRNTHGTILPGGDD